MKPIVIDSFLSDIETSRLIELLEGSGWNHATTLRYDPIKNEIVETECPFSVKVSTWPLWTPEAREFIFEMQKRLHLTAAQALGIPVQTASQWFRHSGLGTAAPVHADNAIAFTDPESGETRYRKYIDCEFSAVVWLGVAEGGTVRFPQHDFEFLPGPGTLALFPSDERYLHGGQPITAGTRFVWDLRLNRFQFPK